MKIMATRLGRILTAAAFALTTVSAASAEDDPAREAQEIVDKARTTLDHFLSDPNMTWFRDNIGKAKGLYIVPNLVKAGFVFGGSGGTGVFLTKSDTTGTWSNPAFYTIGSATFGLQAGAQAAEVMMLVMTDKGKNAMLSTKFQLGGDASVAAGPVGAGAQAATTDILQFSRTKGVFGGLTLEGAAIAIRDKYNHAYYGRDVSPVDILVKRTVSNTQAAPLIATVMKAAAQ